MKRLDTTPNPDRGGFQLPELGGVDPSREAVKPAKPAHKRRHKKRVRHHADGVDKSRRHQAPVKMRHEATPAMPVKRGVTTAVATTPAKRTQRVITDRAIIDRTKPPRLTPQRTTPQRTTPQRTTPQRTTPQRTTPQRTTPPETKHKFTPQVPIPKPSGAQLDAPITVTTGVVAKDLPTPNAMLDPKLALAKVAVDVKGALPVTGGSYGPLSTESGAIAFNAGLRNGVLDAHAKFTDGKGNPQPATAALLVPVHGVDYNPENKRVEADTGLGRFDITGKILKGRDQLDVDTLLQTVGADKPFPIGSPPKLKAPPSDDNADTAKMVDSSRAVVTADIAIAPSDRPVSFGPGTQLAFAPGTKAHVERVPGKTTISFDANLRESRFGQPGGPVLTTGKGHVHVTATQTLDANGKPRWQVDLEKDPRTGQPYRLDDVRLSVPVAGKTKPDFVEIGSITPGQVRNNTPLVTTSNGVMRVNLDAKMTDIRGAMSVRDGENRQAQVVLGNATGDGKPMSVDAHLALDAGVDTKRVRSMTFTANTEALNVGINAPQGLQLARGQGFNMGLQPGRNTAITGAGEFRFSLDNGVPNFSVKSRDGIKAKVQLGLGTGIDRKDKLGNDVRLTVKDGSEVEATVREYDLRSGKTDIAVRVAAGLQSAEVVSKELQAKVDTASGTLDARITKKPGDRSPEIIGNIHLDVAGNTDPSRAPTLQLALPSDVKGFRERPGEGSIMTQLLDGKASADVPIHVRPDGSFVSDNGTQREAQLAVDNIKFVSKIDDPRAAGKLPEVMAHQALVDARAMHDQLLATHPDTPLPALQPPASVVDTTLQDINRGVVKKIEVSKLLGTAVDNVNVDVKLTIPEDHTLPAGDAALGFFHADAVFKKGGTIRLSVQGHDGQLDAQGATLPDGTPNPTPTRDGQPTPSGLSFSPGAMRIVVNKNEGMLGGSLNVDGVDIVRDPADAKKVKLVPRISNAVGLPGWYVERYGESIAASALKTATGSDTVPRTQRELIAMATGAANLHIDLESDIVKKALDSTPPEHRAFVSGLINSSELRAAITPRATDDKGQPVDIDLGIGKIRAAANQPIIFSRVAGQVDVRGSAEIRDSGFTTPTLGMSFKDARADFHFSQDQNASGDAGAALVELRRLQAHGFTLTSNQNSLRANVTNANLENGDLTVRLGAQPTVEGRLTGLGVDTASFTNTDGSVFDLQGGRVSNVTFNPNGAIKVDGIEGTLAANTRFEHSQFYLQHATVRNGSFEFTDKHEVIARLPQLTDVRGAVTDLNVPAEGSAPGGVSAKVKRVSFEGDALDVGVNPTDGVSLVTPEGKAVRVWGNLSGTAAFPSPRLEMAMDDASFVGSLNSIQFAPHGTKQIIDVSDAYLSSGKVRGRAVFGPDGSALADTQLRDASVEFAVKKLKLGTGSFAPTIASNVIGRVAGTFALPDTVDGKPAIAHGSADGSIEFAVVNDDDVIRARAEAIFSKGRFGGLLHAAPDQVEAMQAESAAFYRRHVGVLPPNNPFRLPTGARAPVPQTKVVPYEFTPPVPRRRPQ